MTVLEQRAYDCPVCEGVRTLGYTRKTDSRGRMRWFCNCFSCDAAGISRGDYVRALAKATGVPASHFIEGPPDCLGLSVGSIPDRPPAAFPSADDLRAWQRALARNVDARRYLRRARGLALPTVHRAGLGFDGRAIVVPCFDSAGGLVNVKRRGWPNPFTIHGKQVKMLGLAGRPAVWFPSVPEGSLLLCAGEFDALLCRQHGLPAVTTTCGVQVPAALIGELRPKGRRIAVAFDSGEEGAAEAVAGKLRAAGAEAWVVDLGLDSKEDLTDWFVKHGRSADDLRARIIAARRAD